MKRLPRARTRDIVVQSLNAEILIYDLNIHKAYNLNETSAAVYQACDGKTTFEELKRRHKFTDDLIFLALDQLKEDKLIEADDSFASPFGGISRREAIRKVGLASLVALPVISSLTAPTAAMAQSLTAAICTTPGGAVCNTATDCTTVAYCGTAITPRCTCVANCCVECAGSTVACAGVCVDVDTDPSNCGVCGLTCGVGNTCVAGTCVPVPPPPPIP